MKKIIFLLGFFVCALPPLMAQEMNAKPDQAAQEKAKKETEKITKDLSLDGKQTSKVQEKLGVYYMKKAKLMQSSKSAEEKQKALKNIDQQKVLEMRDILNESQYNKFVQQVLNDQQATGAPKK